MKKVKYQASSSLTVMSNLHVAFIFQNHLISIVEISRASVINENNHEIIIGLSFSFSGFDLEI